MSTDQCLDWDGQSLDIGRVGEERTSRQYLSIQAVGPYDGKPTEIKVSMDRIRQVGRRSMGQAKEAAFLVPEVLQKPDAIYEGLRRDEDEPPPGDPGVGWLCYCKVPSCSYGREGRMQPPHRGEVMLVFVNEDRVAYQWYWDKADVDCPDRPRDADKRFRRKVL